MAEYQALFRAGLSFTRQASAPITGGQLVYVTGSGTVAPTGSSATPMWLGVAGNDASTGDQLTVYRMGVQRVVASANITAGQTVESANLGRVAPHTNGTNDFNIVGVALTTATTGQLVEVSFVR